jgi:hypothetical protein
MGAGLTYSAFGGPRNNVRATEIENRGTAIFKLSERTGVAAACGHAHAFEAVIFPDGIRKELDRLEVKNPGGQGENFKKAYAAGIAHELVCHAIPGGKHSSEEGFVDSTLSPWDATEISPEGAKRLFQALQIPLK